MKLRIRDGHAMLNGDKTEYTMDSGSVDIIAEDGRTMFGIRLCKDYSLEIDSGVVCKNGGILHDDAFDIRPISSNRIRLTKPEYK